MAMGGDAQRQRQRRRARPSVLFVALVVFLLLPDGAESIFGFGRGAKKAASAAKGAAAEPAASTVEEGDASGEAPPLKGGRGTGNAGDGNAGKMGAWEGEDGQLHMIRAERKPSGLWEFPVGTVVPKVRADRGIQSRVWIQILGVGGEGDCEGERTRVSGEEVRRGGTRCSWML